MTPRNGTKTTGHHPSNAKCSRTPSLWSCWHTNSRLPFAGVGSRGPALTFVRFNQGSKQDVEALVDNIYAALGMGLDYILPVAVIPENGRESDILDDKSELAHQIVLVNLLRIQALGAVKANKASRHFVTRPTQATLLSPNYGLFGNDGLYSESKISPEILFNQILRLR
jgi:fatty acid synthase subunit alpha, fungi type